MEEAKFMEVADASTQEVRSHYPKMMPIPPELIIHQSHDETFHGQSTITILHLYTPISTKKFHYYIGDALAGCFVGLTQFPIGTIQGSRAAWDPVFVEGGPNLREAQNQINLYATRFGWVYTMVALCGLSQIMECRPLCGV